MWRDCSRREIAARATRAALAGCVLLACGTLSIPQERKLGEDANRDIRRQVKLLRDRKARELDVEIAERQPTPRRR